MDDPLVVMAGLVPAIYVSDLAPIPDVDARHKAGHDEGRKSAPRRSQQFISQGGEAK
jgi:hypothetical protein